MNTRPALTLPIADINIGQRFRSDFGNIDGLAASIADLGLLHAVVVTPDKRLVAGARRLKAVATLGWDTVPVRIVDLDAVVLGEHAENEVRKNFTRSERVAIGRMIKAQIGERRGRPSSGEIPQDFGGIPRGVETGEHIAQRVGFGNAETYRQAESVVDHGAPELVAAFDSDRIAVSVAADIATLPEPEQRKVADLSDAEVTAWAKNIRAAKEAGRREERFVRIGEIARGNADVPDSARFPVIYADPPWRYEHAISTSREIENQYPTMSLDEICDLNVSKIATDDAILYVWATAPKLAECIQVIGAWGFSYRTNFVWVKDKLGMGFYTRSQHELLLVATRGNMPAPAPSDRASSVVHASRGEHSVKPKVFHEMIESFYPALPRIELFSRRQREGWAAWGNQAAEAAA